MNDLTPAQRQVPGLVDGYRSSHCRDAEARLLFSEFVTAHVVCCERTSQIGHFTGSAWLVSQEGQRVLSTHHCKLDRWLIWVDMPMAMPILRCDEWRGSGWGRAAIS